MLQHSLRFLADRLLDDAIGRVSNRVCSLLCLDLLCFTSSDMDVDFLTAHLRPRQTNNDNITISTYHTGIKTDIDIDVLQQVAVKMVVLSIDSYNKLLQTEQIIIEIGDEDVREQVAVHKGFLALRSTYLAQQLDKSGMMEQEGKIQITNVPSSAVKLFVKWCYEGRLHFPFKEGEKVNIAKLSKRKALLIDVWFFCDM